MDAERWQRTKAVFEAALTRDREQWSAFLAEACAGDDLLRDEVERLLAGHERAGSFLKRDFRSRNLSILAPEEAHPAFAPDDILSGRFKVIRFIGKGGMGEVYEARDLELGVRLGLKTIRAEISANPETIKRFKQEIQLARKVTHPNVCRIFDLEHHRIPQGGGESTEVHFLTMELLEGETLGERLRRRGRLNAAEALPIVRQMAEGLAAAHDAGVIHRDFKPGNAILVASSDGTQKERAVITDFGLACSTAPSGSGTTESDDQPQSSLTGKEMLIGTPAYMAPEQLDNGEITSATDIYALGLVMYEMVTGNRPFAARGPHARAASRFVAPPPSPRILVPELDERWETVVLRCLELDPAVRFQNARELISALDPNAGRGTTLRRRLAAAALLAGLVLVPVGVFRGAAIVAWLERQLGPPPVAHERRRVLVADFDNRTGDPVFDQTLRELVTTSLEQSKSLSVVPSEGVQESLQRMRRPADVRIDQPLGLEICIRESLDALVLGSIARIGTTYVVNLTALGPDGSALFSAEERAEDQRRVLPALDRALARLRAKLGESPESISKGEPLERVTSASLDALRLFSQGKHSLLETHIAEAQALMERAVELDPNFAMAYEYLGTIEFFRRHSLDGQKHLHRAVELSDRLTERERLKILGDYNLFAVRDLDKAVSEYRVLLSLYPDDYGGHANLAMAYQQEGHFDLAAQEYENTLKLADTPAGRSNMAYVYFYEGQTQKAIEEAQGALNSFPQASSDLLYALAMFSLDEGQFDQARAYLGKLASAPAGSAVAHRALADLEMSQGHYRAAARQLQTALTIDEQADEKASQARTHLQMARLDLETGDRKAAAREAVQGARLTEDPEVLAQAASVMAEAGDLKAAGEFLKPVEQAGWKPWIAGVRAELLRGEGKPGMAAALVASDLGYPVRTPLLETRARVYEADHRPAEAIEAYKELIARGAERATDDEDEPAFHCVVTAYYRLGVIYAELGDSSNAKASLERYLEFASQPDADAPFVEDSRDRLRLLMEPGSSAREFRGRTPTPAT